MIDNDPTFAPHSLVACDNRDFVGTTTSFFEVVRRDQCWCEPPCWALNKIEAKTGMVLNRHSLPGKHLYAVPPNHPVHILWSNRRLADRLEGLDRT